MPVRLVLARSFLDAARAELDADPARVVRLEAGTRRGPDRLEVLVPARVERRAESVSVRIFRPPPALRRVSHHYWRAFERRRYEHATLDLGLAPDGACCAAFLLGESVSQVDEVLVAGAGMERWRPAAPIEAGAGEVPERGAFSRYAGALGGSRAHGRLRDLSITVVGSARLGSALAVALARAGVRKLTLVDADVLEDHSLDAVECAADAVGRRKVEAVAAHLAVVAPGARVTALAEPVQSPAAYEACAAADLVVSAPDDNRARLTAALAAAAHHRPHLDVGAGVFGEGETWTAGADVRLMLPLEGCLLDAGGLDLERRAARDWRRQRAGSLRSLNQMAAGQAMALVERLVTGDLARSIWMRLVLGRDGRLATEERTWARAEGCRVCARAGVGDAALGAWVGS